MRRKKFIKHQVQYHVLNMKKEWFFRTIISKHEQNVVKSGQNILPVREVKMKWIVKGILRNTKRQYICWIVVIYKHRCFHVKKFHQKGTEQVYLQAKRSSSNSENEESESPAVKKGKTSKIVFSKPPKKKAKQPFNIVKTCYYCKEVVSSIDIKAKNVFVHCSGHKTHKYCQQDCLETH